MRHNPLIEQLLTKLRLNGNINQLSKMVNKNSDTGIPEMFLLQWVWVMKFNLSILFHIFHTQKSEISPGPFWQA